MKTRFHKIFVIAGRVTFTWSILFLLFFPVQLLKAQATSTSEYQVKAVFLYNFTKFIEWSPAAFQLNDDPFIIGIIGNDPFGTFLEEAVTGEKAGTHPIIVRHFKDEDQVTDCHMIFINSNNPERIKSILAAVSGKNILTVSDANNFLKWGGIVRFFKENNRIRLQVNTAAAKEAQLSISSKLLSVAQIY